MQTTIARAPRQHRNQRQATDISSYGYLAWKTGSLAICVSRLLTLVCLILRGFALPRRGLARLRRANLHVFCRTCAKRMFGKTHEIRRALQVRASLVLRASSAQESSAIIIGGIMRFPSYFAFS